MQHSFYLFARPSFVGGAALAIDIGGTLVEYNYTYGTDAQADARAIQADWNAVGHDLWRAIDESRKTVGREK